MALLILYASLPCVEGSPWGNVNGLTVEGHERSKEQQKQFTTLLKSFVKLLGEVYDERTLIAFELSKNCKYWRWPMVRKFLIERFMSVHHFDGCMMGVLGNNGQPMKKSWTIAGNFKELFKTWFLLLWRFAWAWSKSRESTETCWKLYLQVDRHASWTLPGSCEGPSIQKESL